MTERYLCSDLSPHLHGPVIVEISPALVLTVEGRPVGAFPVGFAELADRVCVLLDRHGLADVPDTVSTVKGCPWPPPTGEPRLP